MNKKYVALSFVAATAIAVPEAAMAADPGTLGGVADNLKANLASFKTLAIQIGYLAGLVFFLMGLFLVYRDTKQPNQGHLKNGVISLFVGVCLLGAPKLIEITSSSSVGASSADLKTNGGY